jgi:hypothetical protein
MVPIFEIYECKQLLTPVVSDGIVERSKKVFSEKSNDTHALTAPEFAI